ncbi:hypothetical protein KW797_01970 [Candidatus Parcubacteria bacterium]|nr:hypothetical protein [Candidatus Parcubacteria bacterium]
MIWAKEDKARLYKAADSLALSHETKFADVARSQFEVDKRDVFALVNAVKGKARKEAGTIFWNEVADDLSLVFNDDANQRWANAFSPAVQGVVFDAAGMWDAELGFSFDVHNFEAEDWFNKTSLKFADPITKTSERELAVLLQQAEIEGWTITKTQKALTDVFNQWAHGTTNRATFAGARLPPYRTEMIARTVSMQSYNAGTTTLFENAGVEEREWLATQDDRTRDDHLAADGQVMGINEPFVIGGFEMMYPGDDSLGAPLDEIINCRCATLPILPEMGLTRDEADEGEDAVGGEMAAESAIEQPPVELETPSYDQMPEPKDYAALNDWPIEDVKQFVEDRAAWIQETLSASEQEALTRYTGSSFERINDRLRQVRSFSGTDEQSLKFTTHQLDLAFAKSGLDEDTKLYRGVREDSFPPEWKGLDVDLLPGMVYTDNGFTSTSTDKTRAEGWGGSGNESYKITILAPKDYEAIYVQSISQFPNEREMLLARGASFRIVDATQESNGLRRITVELLPK